MTAARRRLRGLLHASGLTAALSAALWPGVSALPAPDGAGRLVVVLDVSMSMRARDVAPDRLSEARRQILEALAASAPAGAAVVVFAGDARLVCPLTSDLTAVREALEVAAPADAAAGGSDLASALERAASVAAGHGQVLLVSDGESGPAAESDPLPVAARLREQTVGLTVVGVGSDGGATVPSRQPPGSETGVDESGAAHRSRLDEVRLQRVAAAAGGRYQRLVAGGRLDLAIGGAPPAAPPAPALALSVVMAAFALLLAEAGLWWLSAESNPWP